MIKVFTEQDIPDRDKLEVFTNRAGEEYSEEVIAINKDGVMRLIFYNFTKKRWVLGFLGDDYSYFCNNERNMKFAWMYPPEEFVCE